MFRRKDIINHCDGLGRCVVAERNEVWSWSRTARKGKTDGHIRHLGSQNIRLGGIRKSVYVRFIDMIFATSPYYNLSFFFGQISASLSASHWHANLITISLTVRPLIIKRAALMVHGEPGLYFKSVPSLLQITASSHLYLGENPPISASFTMITSTNKNPCIQTSIKWWIRHFFEQSHATRWNHRNETVSFKIFLRLICFPSLYFPSHRTFRAWLIFPSSLLLLLQYIFHFFFLHPLPCSLDAVKYSHSLRLELSESWVFAPFLSS